jgi:DNA-binding MarR family transcriptional regulator
MAGQGRYVSVENIQRIIYLLATTEMTVTEIAERMSIHKSTISAINKRFQVRRLRPSCAAQGMLKKKSA